MNKIICKECNGQGYVLINLNEHIEDEESEKEENE